MSDSNAQQKSITFSETQEVIDNDPCEILPISDLLLIAEGELNLQSLEGVVFDAKQSVEGVAQEVVQSDVQSSDNDSLNEPSQDALASLSEEVIEASKVEPSSGDENIAEIVRDSMPQSDVSRELAQIEPAAGDGNSVGGLSAGRGYGFQSDFQAQGVISLDDVGPIAPTALEYGVNFINDEFFIQERDGFSLLNPLNPSVEIEDHQVYEDGSVQVILVALPDSANGALTVVISGIPSGWGVGSDAVDDLGAPLTSGVFDAVSGTWSIVLLLGQGLGSGPVFEPPVDSDIDALNLVVTVSEVDSGAGRSGSSSVGFDIVVDAVADAPEIDALDDVGNEGEALDVDVSALVGEEVNNGVGLDDGSENIIGYEISGIPAGFVLSAGVETAPGSGVYALTSAEIVGLTVTPVDPDFSGSLNLTATVFTTENPVSDGEFDLTNNQNSDSDVFTLTWNPVADAPELSVSDAVVKEDASVFVPIDASLADTDGSEFLTVVVEGVSVSWGFAGVGWVQIGPESYEIVLTPGQDYADGITLTPPADSDIDLTGVTVRAVSTEVGNGDVSSQAEIINVIVDAVADAAEVDGVDNVGSKGSSLSVDISGSAGDTDGSESVVKYEVSGVPDGFTFNAGTDLGGGVWEFGPSDLVGLEITPPADYVGDFDVTVTIFTTENPVDGEPDASDNTATRSDVFNLEWKPTAVPPKVVVNNGIDDVVVKEDGSVEVPIVATLDPNGSGNEVLTVTVTGIDPSWGFSAPVGDYDDVAGTWTVTLAPGEDLSSVLTFTPPADSDIDLSGLQASASAYEPSTDTTANATPDDFNVIVDAVADVPNLNAGDASGEEGATVSLDISTFVNDVDGSEVVEVIKISNLPAGSSLTAGAYNAVDDVWELLPSDLVGLGLIVPDGVVGEFTLNIESVAFEQNTSGMEVDLTDNRSSSFDTITLTVQADDVPVVKDAVSDIDESDLDPSVSVNGNVSADFGDDNPGAIQGNGTYLIGGLTSGGVDVDVRFDLNTNTYVGFAGSAPVFELVIENDGDYTFTLLGVVDHPDDSDPNDFVPLEFGVVARDGEGDAQDAVIKINVYDDGPRIEAQYSYVGEHKLENGPIVINKDLDFSYGEDGAGSVKPNGQFITKYEVGGASQILTSNGGVVDVSPTTDGYVGVVGSETIFTLVIDVLSGEYTYTQYAPVDHPEGVAGDDVLWMQFGITVTDADGDSVDTIIGMDVYDDTPDVQDDCVSFNASEGVFTDNVLSNDDLSIDFDNLITQVKFGQNVVDLPVDGSYETIVGEFGSLMINNQGDYTYTVFDDVFDGSALTASLDPIESDTVGQQELISKNGITVRVANDGEFDITWLDLEDGSGLGIDKLGVKDSLKVFPSGETFDISFDQSVASVDLTIAEVGSNNDFGQHGVDFVIRFADGSQAVGEQQFVPGEIVDGVFSFTVDASDYGDQLIAGIDLYSSNDGDYKTASFLLNNVAVTYPSHDEDCVEDQFEYVLSDYDGDQDAAVLKIKTFAPDDDLIVGQNVSDDESSDVPHLVNGDRGIINGGDGQDILVGDSGGSVVEPQSQDYNFAFVVDVSGSMGSASDSSSKLSLMVDAIENLIGDYGSYDGGEIKVHITPFSKNVLTGGTFTVTDPTGLADALHFINNLDGNGYTNYEAPLQEVNAWLQSGDPLGGDAITTTYFFSDGNPNKFVDQNGNIGYDPSGDIAMDEITGSDGSDEVALLHSLNDDVIAVGIEATDLIMSRLDVIDLDGNAIRVDDPNDLTAVLAETNDVQSLLSAGGDVIEGGSENDIVFGDVLFTDDLADLHGLSLETGAGWEVFERLENGESSVNSTWTRDDTIDYIRDNSVELARESLSNADEAREGGNDVIDGGSGDDILFGQEGDDVISGGLGDDFLYGGSGADMFVFEAIADGLDVIADFNAVEGDRLDLSSVLFAYDPLTDDISDFVIATEVSGDTVISVDQAGNAGASGASGLAVLSDVIGFDLDVSIKTDSVV